MVGGATCSVLHPDRSPINSDQDPAKCTCAKQTGHVLITIYFIAQIIFILNTWIKIVPDQQQLDGNKQLENCYFICDIFSYTTMYSLILDKRFLLIKGTRFGQTENNFISNLHRN